MRAAAPRQLSLPLADELSAGGAAVPKSGDRTSSRRVVRQFEVESAQSGSGSSGTLGRTALRRNDGRLFRRWGTRGGRQAALFHPEKRVITSSLPRTAPMDRPRAMGAGAAVLF